jgi:hypothetical protein
VAPFPLQAAKLIFPPTLGFYPLSLFPHPLRVCPGKAAFFPPKQKLNRAAIAIALQKLRLSVKT